MSDNDKNRIKIKLPAVSYDIVKLAATLTGTSVKSFAAQAVINAALHVTAEIENRSLGSNIEADIHLTEEEAQALLALVESLDTHDGKDEDVEEATAEDFEEEEPAECECDCEVECKCDCDCKCEDDAECKCEESEKAEEPAAEAAPAAQPKARHGRNVKRVHRLSAHDKLDACGRPGEALIKQPAHAIVHRFWALSDLLTTCRFQTARLCRLPSQPALLCH